MSASAIERLETFVREVGLGAIENRIDALLGDLEEMGGSPADVSTQLAYAIEDLLTITQTEG